MRREFDHRYEMICQNQKISAILLLNKKRPRPERQARTRMDEQQTRRRQTQFTRASRANRILERTREGWACDEVARKERLTEQRVRQIVTRFLQEREAVSDDAHSNMQIDRLGRAMRVAGDAAGRGDIRAISPFIRVIDRLDRWRAGAFAAGKGRLRIFCAVEAP